MAFKVRITGTGSYAPKRILTNDEICKGVASSDEWIYQKLGIKERRIADVNESTSDMAVIAAKRALENSTIGSRDLELIIVATATPDRQAPSTAAIVQGKIGDTKAAAFDVAAVCSGFIYAQSIASSMISAGMVSNALVIGADRFSGITDWSRKDCVFFGDGAGAVVLERSPQDSKSEILVQKLYADGSGWENFTVKGGGSEVIASHESVSSGQHFFEMNGKAVFDTATKVLPEVIAECLAEVGLTVDDIDHVIPHQPSINILKKTAEISGIPFEKFHTNMRRYANTSAGTVPLILDEVIKEKKIKDLDIVLMIAVGSGWTWGASILRW